MKFGKYIPGKLSGPKPRGDNRPIIEKAILKLSYEENRMFYEKQLLKKSAVKN